MTKGIDIEQAEYGHPGACTYVLDYRDKKRLIDQCYGPFSLPVAHKVAEWRAGFLVPTRWQRLRYFFTGK